MAVPSDCNSRKLPCRRKVLALLVFFASWLSIASAHSFNPDDYPPQNVIARDVCVIGGGSSGVYAAIGLLDLGKSVVVVERQDYLGGQTETYIDPATKIHINAGVAVLDNLPVVRSYLQRLNIPLTNTTLGSGRTIKYVDLRTGELTSYLPPDPSAALLAYGEQLAKYPYLSFGFDLPYPVPEELLLPFGDFVTKYNLQAAVFTIFTFNEGQVDLLRQPTIYVINYFSLALLQSLQTGFLIPTSGDLGEIYVQAGKVLGSDNVLLSTYVVATDRRTENGCVSIIVKAPDGFKLIKAKKLVLAIPLKIDNLVGFDLTWREFALFSKFRNDAYYAGVVRDSGIPDNVLLYNVDPSSLYNLPVLPGIYVFSSRAPGLQSVYYGSVHAKSDGEVESAIIAAVGRLREAGIAENITTKPSFARFSSYTPFRLAVSVSEIAGGFYRELYSLQGESNTYYTGATFHAQDSALLWRFTEALLPTIVA